ncbi:MAG: DUF3572 domain-containing protein [Sphingomonadaceae bacterium]
MTIRDPDQSPEHQRGDPDVLALKALGWVLADEQRAERLLSLTGLTPDVLREQLTDRGVLGAVLEFLANHDPDLLLAADALNVPPEKLIEAREKLAR